MANINLKEHTAMFTGGRPKSLYAENPYASFRINDYERIIQNVLNYIEKLYIEQHIYRFISGGAQGFDQLAFQAVARLKAKYPDVENIVYIPFNNQDSRWMDKGLFSKTAYRDMLSKADSVYVCEPNLDTNKVPFNVVTRALMYRNECMCNDSSICIGQYPDHSWRSPYTKGGTASCLRYATSLGMKLHINDFRM